MSAQDQQFDVVIVGSGATGGWAAKQLTEAGLSVAVLEAGRKLDPEVDYTEHKRPFEMPFRGRRLGTEERQARQPVQSLCYQCDEYTNHLFIDDTEHPYTTPADRPFTWIRGRHVGGKSIMWARQTYRLSDYDMKAASRDGFGIDWQSTTPLSCLITTLLNDLSEFLVRLRGCLICRTANSYRRWL